MPGAWAKLERDKDTGRETRRLGLISHGADVAAVVEALLSMPTIARRLARLAGRRALDSIM